MGIFQNIPEVRGISVSKVRGVWLFGLERGLVEFRQGLETG